MCEVGRGWGSEGVASTEEEDCKECGSEGVGRESGSLSSTILFLCWWYLSLSLGPSGKEDEAVCEEGTW